MLFRSDRKSTRLNSSHLVISYAVFCLKKKKTDSSARALEWVAISTRGLPQVVRLYSSDMLRPVRMLALFRISAARRALFFFFNERGTPKIYPFSLPGPLPI